jgi:uncharacterized protein (UPF0276 family)
MQAEFFRRLEQVPVHGLGLSVDVHSPDLAGLLRALQQRHVRAGYIEVFRTTPTALTAIRSRVGEGLLTYHGEGLWLTQPEAADDPLFRQEVRTIAEHLQTLQSAWLNHECATKYIAGYCYGTYLPPLYTEPSAAVVADNTLLVQHLLDQHCRLANGAVPLVLLELPPLTYFVAGTLPIQTFFRVVIEKSPCGLVLDVGHLWTVFRYSGAWRRASLAQFADAFLKEFPLDRVVEIHIAGLALHESSVAGGPGRTRSIDESLPAWTDAHAAPIPPVLFELLDQILSHPRLTSLRGLALEVDMKPEDLIVDEFSRFNGRYTAVFPEGKPGRNETSDVGAAPLAREPLPASMKQALGEAYDHYARVVAGRAEPDGPEWNSPWACADGLDTYQSVYLPYEILHWGGEVEAMFPESCRRLHDQGIPLARFVPFWFRRPRPLCGSYDFFLLKIERFVEFVREEAPEWLDLAEREAGQIRQGYDSANSSWTN